jgi:hypothetical protein
LVLACCLLAVSLVPLTGGRLSSLASLRFRTGRLLLVALAGQVVVMQVPGVPGWLASVVHLGSYAMAASFVALNRHVPGLWLLALGAGLNGVVIALNGGTLPASESAMRIAGLGAESGFANSAVLGDPVLPWFGDVFAVPASWPLANVFSVGDVLIVLGAAWVVHAAARWAPVTTSEDEGPSAECVSSST